MSFLESLKNKSNYLQEPFPHWEFSDPLTEAMINEIYNTEIDDPARYQINYDGTRAIDGALRLLDQVLEEKDWSIWLQGLSRRKWRAARAPGPPATRRCSALHCRRSRDRWSAGQHRSI